MAIMFVRAQVISRGAGRSIVSAAAYRHRARMMDEQAGTSFSYRGGAGELKHEELALPDQIPAWLSRAIEGKTVAGASEALESADFTRNHSVILDKPPSSAAPEAIARLRSSTMDRGTSCARPG